MPISRSRTIGFSLSITLLLLGGVSLYALRPGPQQTAPAPAVAPSPAPATVVELQKAAIIPAPPLVVQEKPPFTIRLPAPFTDADTLQFLAASYAAGRSDGSDLVMARALLGSSISRATAQWLLLRSGVPLTFQWYQNFRESVPDWPETAGLRRRIEIALLTSQMSDAEKARYLSTNPPLTTTGRIFMGKQLLTAGRKQEALDQIRPVWTQEKLLEATERQIRTDYAGILTPQDHRLRMIALMATKNWDAALRAAKDSGDGAELLVKARMAVLANSKDAQGLVDALPKAVQNDPVATLSRWLLLARQKKHKEIVDMLGQMTAAEGALQLSPTECNDWQKQQRTLARSLVDTKDFELAYQAASAPLSVRGCVHNDADFLAGWIALRFINRPDAARSHFEKLLANADSDARQARAAYWLGRVSERLGDKTQADKAYGQAARIWNNFYGQLAAEVLSARPPVPPVGPDLSHDLRQKLEMSSAWQAIRLLEMGNAGELAFPLYVESASVLPDRAHLASLAALAVDMKNTRAALAVTKIAAQRGFELGAYAYPDFGLPEVPDKTGLADKALMYTISRQESAFNPKARSPVALGLMQLKPSTARMNAERNGLAYNIDWLTDDPAYNVRLGMAHFGALQSEWKGSLILSFAAYNAGSGNVKKWISANGDPRTADVDAIDWIESIPFMETRHYVQRLSESLIVYRHLMGVASPTRVR